jgi:voltage-gated potassium channel
VAKALFVVAYATHVLACMFMLVVRIEEDDAHDNFTGAFALQTYGLGSQYLRSFYWGFTNLAGFNSTVPNTQRETILCIFASLIGLSLFTAFVGITGSIVTHLDSTKLIYRAKMDRVNDYMTYKRIPSDLQGEVRDFYEYLWKSGRAIDESKALDDLPPYLMFKLRLALNREIVLRVPLFKACADNQDFLTELVKCLQPKVFLPKTFVVKTGEIGANMYFVVRGELNVVNDEGEIVHTLCNEGFFGEIALLYDTKRTASILTRTYCDILVLNKKDFGRVLQRFPKESEIISRVGQERFQKVIEYERRRGSPWNSPPASPRFSVSNGRLI